MDKVALSTLAASTTEAKDSLAGAITELYSLASKLHTHSTSGIIEKKHQFHFAAKSLPRHASLDQMWSHLHLLGAPVLQTAGSNLRFLQSSAKAEEEEKATKKVQPGKKHITLDEEDDDDFEDMLMDESSGEEEEEEDNSLDDDDDAGVLSSIRNRMKETKMSRQKGSDRSIEADNIKALERFAAQQDAALDDEDGEVGGNDAEEEDFSKMLDGADDEEGDEENFDEEGNFGDEEDGDDLMNELYGDDDDGEEEEDGNELYGDDDEDQDEAAYDMEDGWETGVDPAYSKRQEDEDYERGLFRTNDDILAGDGFYGDGQAVGFGTEEENGYLPTTSHRAENDDDLDLAGKTPYEQKLARQAREIERIEQQRAHGLNGDSGDGWAMKGEVDARQRPKDSLLDIQLDFDHGMKSVPVITEAFTAKLEDRIKKRIIDANFDDVVRKFSATSAADILDPTKGGKVSAAQAAHDAEKSKLSLMDLYEKDYLTKMQAADGADSANTAEPLTEVEKDELKAIQMWKRLSQHLDALSNYYFTPKPVVEQMGDAGNMGVRVRAVEGQAPALSLEAYGGIAGGLTSRIGSGGTGGASLGNKEQLLAPQDTYRPSQKQALSQVSAEERTSKERRALRKARKESSSIQALRKATGMAAKDKKRPQKSA
jgi:U3 small nucleolar RNA-associated protein MPP10